jgi:hypothetical protein
MTNSYNIIKCVAFVIMLALLLVCPVSAEQGGGHSVGGHPLGVTPVGVTVGTEGITGMVGGTTVDGGIPGVQYFPICHSIIKPCG